MNQIKPRFIALVPLLSFFVIYALTWILTGNMSSMPISIVFLITVVIAFLTFRGPSMEEKIEIFCKGAANDTIILMVLIFIIAGAFAGTARAMGAVDASVNMALALLPSNLLLASVFIAACFISMSMGTSCGTIAALAPIAVGMADHTDFNLPMMLGVVIGGAMFGDSLSFISDTTIVATKTQGCELKDKFKVNIRILFPITILIIIIYIYLGKDVQGYQLGSPEIEWIKVFPYCVVLITALIGMNVINVLTLGLALSGIVGLYTGAFSVWEWASAAQKCIIDDMGELIVVSLMAGGLFAIIQENGGISWLIDKLTRNIKTKRQAETSAALLVSLTDFCTANNTVALIISGPIAKNIADKFNIDNRRMASLLDTFSCSVQGILPYGAQLLIASSLAGVSPITIVPYLFYPVLMGIASIFSIILQRPRKFTHA